MNYRLLSPEDKERNRLGRLHRNKVSRNQKRRKLIDDTLSRMGFYIHAAAGYISSEQVAYVQFGHLGRSRNIVRKMKRDFELYSAETPSLPMIAESEKRQVVRPPRLLHKSRVGTLPACYTGPEIPVASDHVSPYEALEILLNDRSLRSRCRFRVVEFAHKLLGGSLHHAASIGGERLDDGPATVAEVESIERLHEFQNTFAWGRNAYAAFVEQESRAIAAGDWAFMETEELEALLPGLRLPLRMHRQEYLARLHCNDFGGPVALDLHCLTYEPLIRCDLTSPAKKPARRRPPPDFPDYVRDLEREAEEFERLRQRYFQSVAKEKLEKPSAESPEETPAAAEPPVVPVPRVSRYRVDEDDPNSFFYRGK